MPLGCFQHDYTIQLKIEVLPFQTEILICSELSIFDVVAVVMTKPRRPPLIILYHRSSLSSNGENVVCRQLA